MTFSTAHLAGNHDPVVSSLLQPLNFLLAIRLGLLPPSYSQVRRRELITFSNGSLRGLVENPQSLIDQALRGLFATVSPFIMLKVSQLLSNSKIDELVQRNAFFF